MKEDDKDDKFEIIPLNERKEELEKDVARFLIGAAPPRFVSKRRYTRNKYPTRFRDAREEIEYQVEEIRRMKEGYDGLSGKGYGWLHYGYIRSLTGGGKIAPEFRAAQEGFFQKMEDLQTKPGRGLVGYKRRRFGFSWMASWDVLHDCSYTPMRQIGMNSKSEEDSRRLFRFVKFLHANLPDWARVRASTIDKRDFMEFAHWYDPVKKKITANKGLYGVKRGPQSTLLSVAPTDHAHEGNAYTKLLIDEAGKCPNLLTIWGFAEDCLLDNTERIGVPVILGTVGDIDKDGKGLMDMYLNSDAYDLDRFEYHGYNGMLMDEYGNDLVEDAIRWVVYKRDKLKHVSKQMYETYKQKYPLCMEDAFNQVITGGVGNIELINEQILRLKIKSPPQSVGWMRPRVDGPPEFVPNPNGKIIVYQRPDAQRSNGYVAGGDGADHDNVRKSRDTSNLATAILAKPFGLGAPQLVAEYVDRPQKLDEFFEQTAMLLKWYNGTKILIEDNRARMVNYFKEHYPEFLPLVPKSLATAAGGREQRHSLKMTEERRQQMYGLIEDNVDKYSEFIPSIRLLEEFKVIGDLHSDDDLGVAYGIALILLQADKRTATDIYDPEKLTKLVREGGALRRYTHQKPVIAKQRLVHPILG